MEISIQPAYEITVNTTEAEIDYLISDINFIYNIFIDNPHLLSTPNNINDICHLLSFKDALVIAKANV